MHSNVLEEQKGAVMGIYQALYAIGMLVGPVISGTLIDRNGYVGAFRAMAAICALDAAVVILLYKRVQRNGERRYYRQ